MEGRFPIALMDTLEHRDTISATTHNAFTQAKSNRKEGQSRVTMKIAVMLVELPVKKAPHTHKGFVALEHGEKATHLDTLKALHRMSESASLRCRKFRGNPEQMGFNFNPCNACVVNKSANG